MRGFDKELPEHVLFFMTLDSIGQRYHKFPHEVLEMPLDDFFGVIELMKAESRIRKQQQAEMEMKAKMGNSL